jgi:hypothetical protein
MVSSDDDGECCYCISTAIYYDNVVDCNDEHVLQCMMVYSNNNMNSIYSYMTTSTDNNVNNWGIQGKHVIHIYQLFHLC